MTALDIITTAMRRINTIEPGENPDSAEADTGLESLNDMLDAWSTERQMIWTVQRLVFPLTAGKASYTVGLGGDFNMPRPTKISRMGILSYANAAQPMELPIEVLSEADWNLVPVKNITSSLPQQVYDDGDFPYRTLTFWAIPSGEIAVAAVLYVWATISQFQDLATDYEFPPGYPDALKWNLAFRLAGEYGGFMPPQVQQMAVESRARIKSINTPLIDLRCDDALVGVGKKVYNWLTDSPAGSR